MTKTSHDFLKSVELTRTATGKEIAHRLKKGTVKIKKGSRATRNKQVSKQLLIADRRLIAAQLKSEGLSYAEVARVIRVTLRDKVPPGYNDASARNDVELYLDTVHMQTVQEVSRLRNLESMRLDWITVKLMEQVSNPTAHFNLSKVIELLLRVSERRSKLLGLDAPVTVDARLFGDLQINFGLNMAEYDAAAQDPGQFVDPDYDIEGKATIVDDERSSLLLVEPESK